MNKHLAYLAQNNEKVRDLIELISLSNRFLIAFQPYSEVFKKVNRIKQEYESILLNEIKEMLEL